MSSILQPDTMVDNRYRIVRLIGQGGMGAVYEAVDLRFGSTVALKQMFLNPNAPPQQAALVEKAFKREAQTLNHLRHSSLPRVSDYFLDAHGHFLVMDYIKGNDLANWLEQRMQSQGYPFSEQEIVPWMLQVLAALEYLHSQSPPVIHRDIKPHNIKVTPQGEVYLLDFGISKGIAGQHTVSASGHSSVYAYTLAYAPLEQIQGTGTGPRSDLFSLGATMYHLLTGASLDKEPRRDALTRASALVGARPDPLTPPPGLSEGVCEVLMQSLALNPDHRPPSAAAFARGLQGQRAPVSGPTIPVAPHPAQPLPVPPATHSSRPRQIQPLPPPDTTRTEPRRSTPSPAHSPPRRGISPALLIGIVALLLLVVGGGGMLFWQEGKADEEQGSGEGAAVVVDAPTATSEPPTPEPTPIPVTATPEPPTPLPALPVLMGTPIPQPVVPIAAASPNEVQELAILGRGDIRDVAWSPDGTTLAVASSIGIWLYHAETLEVVRFIKTDARFNSVAYSPDGARIISGSSDGTIRVWGAVAFTR